MLYDSILEERRERAWERSPAPFDSAREDGGASAGDLAGSRGFGPDGGTVRPLSGAAARSAPIQGLFGRKKRKKREAPQEEAAQETFLDPFLPENFADGEGTEQAAKPNKKISIKRKSGKNRWKAAENTKLTDLSAHRAAFRSFMMQTNREQRQESSPSAFRDKSSSMKAVNLYNELKPWTALLQGYLNKEADPGKPGKEKDATKLQTFQTYQSIIQNTLNILTEILRRYSDNEKWGILFQGIQRRSQYFSSVARRARLEGRPATWGKLLQEAAEYDPEIVVDTQKVEKQGGGNISDINRVETKGEVRFFKSTQMVKDSETIVNDALSQIPDGAFKQAMEKRYRELKEIQEKRQRIQKAQDNGEQPTETLTPKEAACPEPEEILSQLEWGFIHAFDEKQNLKYFTFDDRARAVIQGTMLYYMEPGWTPPKDDHFCKDGYTFLQKMWPDNFLAVFSGNRYAGISAGSDVTKRNVASSRLAELLGAADLVAHSEEAALKTGDNALTGIAMARAKGQQAGGFQNTGLQITPEFVRQLSCLEVLDQIMAQVDRHMGNYFVQTDKKGRAAGLTSIDNDLAFGDKLLGQYTGREGDDALKKGYGNQHLQPFIGNQGERRSEEREPVMGPLTEEKARKQYPLDALLVRKGISVNWRRSEGEDYAGRAPYIDKSLAQHILALDNNILKDAFSGILEPKAIRALWERVIPIQYGIKTSMMQAEREGRKYLLDPEDWDAEKLGEMAREPEAGTAPSWYMKTFVNAIKKKPKTNGGGQ